MNNEATKQPRKNPFPDFGLWALDVGLKFASDCGLETGDYGLREAVRPPSRVLRRFLPFTKR